MDRRGSDPRRPRKRAVWQQFHVVEEHPVHGGGVTITEENRGNLPKSAIGRTFRG